MKTYLTIFAALFLTASLANAEPTLIWSSVDSGGGTSTSGTLELTGTIGQTDAGTMSNGTLVLEGGFWPGPVETIPGCNLADFAVPYGVLNFFDVSGFVTAYLGSESTADLDHNSELNFFDISIFLQTYTAGCP